MFSKDGSHLVAGEGEIADEGEVLPDSIIIRAEMTGVFFADRKVTIRGIAPIAGGKAESLEQKKIVNTTIQKTCQWRVINSDTARM